MRPSSWCLVLSCFVAIHVHGEGLPSPVDVFLSGQDGYFAFRIPALITSQQGTLLGYCCVTTTKRLFSASSAFAGFRVACGNRSRRDDKRPLKVLLYNLADPFDINLVDTVLVSAVVLVSQSQQLVDR